MLRLPDGKVRTHPPCQHVRLAWHAHPKSPAFAAGEVQVKCINMCVQLRSWPELTTGRAAAPADKVSAAPGKHTSLLRACPTAC